jgi:hypothetical protein
MTASARSAQIFKKFGNLKDFKPARADLVSNAYSLGTEVWIPQKLLQMFSGLVIPFLLCEGYLKYFKMGLGFALHHQIA